MASSPSPSPWPYSYQYNHTTDFDSADITFQAEDTPVTHTFARKIDFEDVKSSTTSSSSVNHYGSRLSTFSGEGNVNYFLEEFESYCLLAKLNGRQKLAAFHLQLRGPARIWFLHLPQMDKISFDTFLPVFKSKYSDSGTVRITDEVVFHQLIPLTSQQTIDQYHSLIVERAANLNKSEHELMSKFIAGLPSQLAFFVRAGNPTTLEEACNSAKMGEAYGYRNAATKSVIPPQFSRYIPPPPHESPFPPPPPVSIYPPIPSTQPVQHRADYQQQKQIQDLQFQVNSLQQQLLQTHINKSPSFKRPSHPTDNSQNTCYSCQALGHHSNQCNWNRVGSVRPTLRCSKCFQNGHTEHRCRQNQGNFMGSRAAEHSPLSSQSNHQQH